MAEATLNDVKTAQYQVNGNVRLSCNITTPEGEIWDTDFVVDPTITPPIEPFGGLQGAVERWVAANPDKILAFTTDSPPPHNDPVWENAPPPDPPPASSDYTPPPELVVPPTIIPDLKEYEEVPAVVEEVPIT